MKSKINKDMQKANTNIFNELKCIYKQLIYSVNMIITEFKEDSNK